MLGRRFLVLLQRVNDKSGGDEEEEEEEGR